VQVLRGPQGTLFGRNTIGGAIVLTTVEPGGAFGGTFSARIGSDDLVDLFLAVDAPISQNLRSRFNFATRQQDGYVKRLKTGEDLGDTDTYSLAGKFIWTPSDQLQIRVQYDYRTADENGNPLVFAASNEAAIFQRVASTDAGCPGFNGIWDALPAVPSIDDDRCANDFQNKGKFRNNGTYPIQSTLDTWGTSARVSYDLSNTITLKSITSYRELDWKGVRDADNTPLTILHTDFVSTGDQFSQELQLLYASERFTGVVGWYYFEEEVHDHLTVFLNTPDLGEQKDSDNNIVKNDTWAIFSQWNFALNDRLSLTLGGRYTEDTKGSIPDQFNYADRSVKYLPVRRYEDEFTAFTLSGSLSYRWSENAMTYISYAEGFKGGGWNSHFNRLQSAAELAMFHRFGPEEADTVEIGFKLDLFSDTLRLNGAIFSTDYSDLQFTYRVGVAPYLANAGEASIEGLELEATWVPTSAWIIEGAVGILDDRIDELATIAGTATGVAVGNSLPYTPDWQANMGISYIEYLNNGLTISPRVDASMQDRTFFDANNTKEISQRDSVIVLNASATIQPSAGPWRITLGVNNLMHEKYPIAGNSSLGTASGYAEIAYARRREYFVNFNFSF
jgi:iron complex outermembrane receptor protein